MGRSNPALAWATAGQQPDLGTHRPGIRQAARPLSALGSGEVLTGPENFSPAWALTPQAESLREGPVRMHNDDGFYVREPHRDGCPGRRHGPLPGRDAVNALDFQLRAPVHREGFPYLGEEVAVNARLPGPGQRWLRHGAVLAGYACLAALAIALGPAGSRGLAGLVAAAAPVVLFPAARAMARFLTWMLILRQPSWGFEAVKAPGLRAAVRRPAARLRRGRRVAAS